ncbi:MAG: hypothetical protein HC790_11355 [Acaryochloridaceae cyanobacterium CSU_3_4]|nr:hypothetical protein [Acaryochloridaceae cyanobacterium CSU_3_4]
MKRESLTIRFPADLLMQAKALKVDHESFNDFVVRALEHEVNCRQAIATHERIQGRRQTILQRTGVQPNSTELIREMRQGNQRRA